MSICIIITTALSHSLATNAANSDGRTERRRERRAAESSEQRETRLARRRVADSLLPLVARE